MCSVEKYIDKKGMIETLSECVAIKSVKADPEDGAPYGKGIADALDFMLETGLKMGFRTENIDGQAGYIEYGHGDDMVAVLGHIDVVPAGDGWDSDPFICERHDGRLTGRGTLDDKGPVTAALYALKAVKDSGVSLKHRIRIIIGTDEESGSKDMARYRETEEMPIYAFTPDAMFPVVNSEKGMVVFSISKLLTPSDDAQLVSASGGLVTNQVPDKAEIKIKMSDDILTFRNTEGRAAHGSTPEAGVNAIDSLFRNLTESSLFEKFPGDLKSFTEFYMKYIESDTTGARLHADHSDDRLGDATMNAGVLEGDRDHIEIRVDYRYPANIDCEQYLRNIEDICGREGLEFRLIKHKHGLYFPEDHELVKTLTEVYAEETGEVSEPVSMGGGTYAKSLPDTVAFGPIFPGHEDTMHQANEHITEDELEAGCRIYAKAMIRLGNL